MAEKIVIPEKFYVNYSMRDDNSYYDEEAGKHVKLAKSKLGFATYQEDNAAFRKRQTTIENWADKKFKGKGETFPNEAREGFKLSEMVTHGGGWNDTSTYWRIVDPTGFELEITSGNVAKLFQYCSIDRGSIAGQCVWGWDKANGSKPVLIPCNSDLYTQAKKTSDIHHAEALSIKTLQLGDKVELKNGTKGTFFGKVTVGYFTKEIQTGFCKMKHEETYVFKTQEGLYFMNTPKVIKVEKTASPYSTKEAEKILNTFLQKRKARYGEVKTASSNKWDICVNLAYISYDGPQQTQFSLSAVPASKIETELKRFNTHSYSGLPENEMIALLKGGQKLIVTGIEATHYDKKLPSDFTVHGHLIISEFDTTTGLLIEKNPNWEPPKPGWNRYSREPYAKTSAFKLSAIQELYNINISYKDFVQKVFR